VRIIFFLLLLLTLPLLLDDLTSGPKFLSEGLRGKGDSPPSSSTIGRRSSSDFGDLDLRFCFFDDLWLLLCSECDLGRLVLATSFSSFSLHREEDLDLRRLRFLEEGFLFGERDRDLDLEYSLGGGDHMILLSPADLDREGGSLRLLFLGTGERELEGDESRSILAATTDSDRDRVCPSVLALSFSKMRVSLFLRSISRVLLLDAPRYGSGLSDSESDRSEASYSECSSADPLSRCGEGVLSVNRLFIGFDTTPPNPGMCGPVPL